MWPQEGASKSQKQKGSSDCGVFAIAFAAATAQGINPSNTRAHLVHCFNEKNFTHFP